MNTLYNRRRGLGLSPQELQALQPITKAPPRQSLDCLVLKEAHRQLQQLSQTLSTTQQQMHYLQGFIDRRLSNEK